MNYSDKTLAYYDEHADSFVQSTVDVQFSTMQQAFTEYLPDGGTILDLGCGSGRDSKAFIDKGYKVIAVDGSAELCKIASQYIGQEVINAKFQDYKPDIILDGIWACASLLHLQIDDICEVMRTLTQSLRSGGCFYVSFKYGDFSGERNGRYFVDLTEQRFQDILDTIPDLYIVKDMITCDVRPGRENEKWLNVFLIKA